MTTTRSLSGSKAPATKAKTITSSSRADFELHSFGMMNSISDGKPGFISDDYLNNIAADTTLTAMEVVSAGRWEHSTDGYLVTDPAMLEMALDANERMKKFFPHALEEYSGHNRGPNSENLCRVCGIEIDDEDEPV